MANDLSILGRLRAGLLGASFTQGFGPSALEGEPSYTYNGTTYRNFHKGVDLVFPHNATIYSPASGQVIAAGKLPGWAGANVVKIQAPNGFVYTLAHFASINVSQGQTIQAGQPVGIQGHTGYVRPADSRGDHVHLEITAPNGQPINPGRNPAEVFWTLAHGLGFGQGYQPGAYDETMPPAPTGNALSPAAVLKALPFQNSAYPTDPYTGPTSGTNTGTNSGTDVGSQLAKAGEALSMPGGIFGAVLGAVATAITGQGNCSEALLVLGMLGSGAVLVVLGFLAIIHDSPVTTIVEPVTGAAGSAASAGAKLAKVAAAV